MITAADYLSRFDLFQGLSTSALQNVYENLKPRSISEGEYLCRKGGASDCLWLIESGLLEIRLPNHDAAISRVRHNDVVGETSLLTGEPRTTDVVAVMPTDVLELDQETFAALTGRHPQILRNVVQILLNRQMKHNLRFARYRHGRRGEMVTLVIGEACDVDIANVLTGAGQSLGGRLFVSDLTGRFRDNEVVGEINKADQLMVSLDRLLAEHGTILVLAASTSTSLAELFLHSDRVVLLMSGTDAANLRARVPKLIRLELVSTDARPVNTTSSMETVAGPLKNGNGVDPGWLARHLTRTKLGLALGAGGAKGYAHVAVIRTLREAGYSFDSVTGSSIGAIIGSGVAQGLADDQLLRAARHLLSYDVCGSYFRLNKEMPEDEGLQIFFDALTEFANDKNIEDLHVPFALMSADLNSREPFLFRHGRLSEALHAALSIPGLAPPYTYEDRRLVDGVTITPVPTQAARDLGADIVVSVNLMSRDELPAWPKDANGNTPPIRPSRKLDPVLETIIMLQTDVSVRHAEEADVVITPRFGPSSWRDLEYESLFEQAGKQAAEQGLDQLRKLTQPIGK